jgi:hypothetical protein
MIMEAKGAKEGGQKNVQKLAKKMRQKKESKKREGGGIYIQEWITKIERNVLYQL